MGMPSRSYKRFLISVEAVSHPDNSSTRLNPVARICSEEGGEFLTSLYCPSAFLTYEEAEAYFFQMAEKWVDEHITSPPKRVRA
jgi:hypothetical protein